MKCDNCKALQNVGGYEYPEYDCVVGVPEDDMTEDDKGNCGCKLHWKTVEKRLRQNDEAYNISIAEGQRMCNPEEYAKVLARADGEKYIKQAMHCVGLDRQKPYKRNGKLYYRPYRNYYNIRYNDPVWSDFKYLGFAECNKAYWEVKDGSDRVFFWLNEDGRKWLADKLGIYKIWEERD